MIAKGNETIDLFDFHPTLDPQSSDTNALSQPLSSCPEAARYPLASGRDAWVHVVALYTLLHHYQMR